MKTTTYQSKPAEKETAEQIRVKPYKEIIEIADEYKCGTEFDDNDNLLIRYSFSEGSLICQRINDLMIEKYPTKSYNLKILAREQILKVMIGE